MESIETQTDEHDLRDGSTCRVLVQSNNRARWKRNAVSTSSKTKKKNNGGRKTREIGIQVCFDRSVSYGKVAKGTTFESLITRILWCKESTITFCFDQGLIPYKRTCDVCGESMTLINSIIVSDGKRWHCRKRTKPGEHERRVSLRSGTFFEGSNMTLEEILQFVYLWVIGTPPHGIQRELGMSANTDVDWSSFCREVCEVGLNPKREPIGGSGVIVDVEVTRFSERKFYRGQVLTDGWVFVGREKDGDKCFTETVTDPNADSFLAVVKKWILPCSLIRSDYVKTYDQIPELPEGYSYETVRHFAAESGVDTIQPHDKLTDFPTHDVVESAPSGFHTYLLWKRQHQGEDLFLAFLKDVAEMYPGQQELL